MNNDTYNSERMAQRAVLRAVQKSMLLKVVHRETTERNTDIITTLRISGLMLITVLYSIIK